MKKLLLSALVLMLYCAQLTQLHAQSNFIRQDSIFSQVRNCQAGVSICIDSFTYDDIADYRFFLDGAPYTATIDPCRVDTIHAYSYLVLFQDGETGPFSLESWQVNSRTFSMNFANLAVLRDSMRIWDPSGNWVLDDAAQIIYGVASGGTSYSCQNILGLTRGGRNEVCYNPGLLFRGIRFDIPVGVRMFVAENIITGDRDTVRLYASCVVPDTIMRNITVGENGNYCVNTSELLGTVRSINNFCFGTTQFANFQTPSGTCIAYSGIARGRDTACLRFCDQYGVCDTTILIVNVSNPTGFRNHIFRDTIRIDSVKQKCDITIPSGTITSFENLCIGSSGTNVNFSLDNMTRCVTYRGVTEGVDTACIAVCNSTGLCDTTYFYIVTLPNPAPPQGVSVRRTDTITTGLSRQQCAWLSVPNSGTIASIQNICTTSGTFATFTLDTPTRCVTYRGVTAVGTDSICYRVCNTLGTCDTTTIVINTLQPTRPLQGITVQYIDTIALDSSRERCNLTRLTNIRTVENMCLSGTGTNTLFTLRPMPLCVVYTAIDIGIDSACLRVCDANGTCDTINYRIVVVPSVPQGQVFRVVDTVRVDSTKRLCNITRLTRVRSITNFCHSQSGTFANFTIDAQNQCVQFNGLRVGTDSACVRVCDSLGTCDTIYYKIVVVPNPIPAGQIFRVVDTVRVDSTKRLCNITRLSNVTGITNFCPSQSGTFANFTIDAPNQCVQFRGLSVGRDSACVRVCNAAGTCDTIYYTIIVVPNPIPVGQIFRVVDTVRVDSTKRLCNITRLSNVTGITNFCASQSGTFSNFTIDAQNQCVQFRGLSVGRDSACVRVCNAVGTCDTIYYTIVVVPNPAPSVGGVFYMVDTIFVDSLKQRCSYSRLPNITSVRNFCQTASGLHALITIEPVTNCLIYRGLEVGIDSACLQVCDASGVCDTIYFRMVVRNLPVVPRRIYRLYDTIFVNDSVRRCNFVAPQGANSISNYCASASGTFANFLMDNATRCVTYRGVAVGSDSACMVICSPTNGCDTTIMYVTVRARPRPTPSVDSITLRVLENGGYCLDTTEISWRPINNIAYCATPNLRHSSVRIDSTRFCVNVNATSSGRDTICLRVCNTEGVCDTTTLYIIVRPDTVRVELKIDTVRIVLGRDTVYAGVDTTQIRGSVDTIYNICPLSSGANATVGINRNNNTLNIRSLTVGWDTACIVVCNRTSFLCDTTIVYIQVIDSAHAVPRPRPSVDSITFRLGTDTTFCRLDLSEIGGAPDTIYNICPLTTNRAAILNINRTTNCLMLSSLAIGVDTACMVVCNRITGLCDTTTVYIRVIPSNVADSIIATDDSATVQAGRPLILNLFGNDTIRSTVTFFDFIFRPSKGTADTLSRGLIRYNPNVGACGLDSFRYIVCTGRYCDTATVRITIPCTGDLVAFNAISPNDDGMNDRFIIQGLDNYPNHELCIFSRWGTQVLNTQNYQQDWQGRWEGKDLPDGTYFYLLRNLDDNAILLSGFLQIAR